MEYNHKLYMAAKTAAMLQEGDGEEYDSLFEDEEEKNGEEKTASEIAGEAEISVPGGGGDAGGDRRERGELVLHPSGACPRQRALYHPRGGGVWDGGAGADVSGSGAGDLAFGPGRGKNI